MGSGGLWQFLSNRSRIKAQQEQFERQQSQQTLDNNFKMLDVMMKGGASDEVIDSYMKQSIAPHLDGALDDWNYESAAGKAAKYIKTGYENYRKGQLGLDSFRQYLETGKSMFPGNETISGMTEDVTSQQAGSLLGMMNQSDMTPEFREGIRQKISRIPNVPEAMLTEAQRMPYNVAGTDYAIPQTEAAQLASSKEASLRSDKSESTWKTKYNQGLMQRYGTMTDSGYVMNPERMDEFNRASLLAEELESVGWGPFEASAIAYDRVTGTPMRTERQRSDAARIGLQGGAMEPTEMREGISHEPGAQEKPTLGQFLQRARQANPGVSDAELIDYYKREYGGQ